MKVITIDVLLQTEQNRGHEQDKDSTKPLEPPKDKGLRCTVCNTHCVV